MRYVDITPTWEALIPVMIMLIESGSADGRKQAIGELTRLAKAMDETIAESKKAPANFDRKWIVDPIPSAEGFHTIRVDDGSEHGDLDAEPIATVYDHSHAFKVAGAVAMMEALFSMLVARKSGFDLPWGLVEAAYTAADRRG